MEINLLITQNPVREKSDRFLIIFKICSGLIMAACIGIYGILFYIDYLGRAQLAAAQGEIAGLQQVNGGLMTDGSLRQVINNKENLIKEVEGEKPRFSESLQELNNLLLGGVRIITLEVKSIGVHQGEVNIQGEAPNHLVVSQFGRILEENESFKDVVIMMNRQDEGRKRVSFAVKINLVKGRGQK